MCPDSSSHEMAGIAGNPEIQGASPDLILLVIAPEPQHVNALLVAQLVSEIL